MGTDCGESKNSESKKGNGCALDYFEKNAYFHGKLITARDMITEQKVGEDKLHMINRLTIGDGIVYGLKVESLEKKDDEFKVKIQPGMAIDCCGRILLVTSAGGAITKKVEIAKGSSTKPKDTVYLYLEYVECLKEAVPIPSAGEACEEKCCYNRILETFDVVYKYTSDIPSLLEVDFPSKANVDSDGEGALLGMAQDYYNRHLKDGCEECDNPLVFLGAFKKSDSGWTLNEVETKRYLSVVYNNKMLYDILANHVTRFDNPHEVTAEQAGAPVSVDGVSNPGGNIDLKKKNAIVIEADDAKNTITIGETHSAKKDNPHEVTAEQAGAPVSVDGVSNPGGDIDLVAGSNITINPDNNDKKITISADGDGNSLDSDGGQLEDVVYVNDAGNVGIGTTTQDARLSINGGLHVGGDSDPGDKNLLVDGDCDISGNLTVKGDTTTVKTTELEVKDNIIRVNKYKKQKTPKVINGGLEVFRGGTAKNAQIIWDEKEDRWKIGVEKTLADILYGPDLTIDNSGNLGIGTTAPSEKLEVDGVVKAAAFMGDGSGLTGISSISNKIPVAGVLGRDVNANDVSISEYSEIRVDELANGLRVLFNIDIDQNSIISNRSCFLTLELPISSFMQPGWATSGYIPGYIGPGSYGGSSASSGQSTLDYIDGYIPTILPADLTAENNVISWHSRDTVLDLQNRLFHRILVHLTVKGRSVSMTGDQQYTDFEVSFWAVPIHLLLAKWGSRGDGDGQFNSPQNVAVDGSGNVYVADSNNNRIQKFDSSGKYIREWGNVEGSISSWSPIAITTDKSGNIYVVDSSNGFVWKFDANRKFLAKWGGQGNGDGQFNTPWGVAMDGSGNVYVADSSNARIQKFDAKGKFLAKWGSRGDGDGQFNYPRNVAIDGSGNVYVADSNNRRIQKFDAEGTFLAKWGGQGNGDGQFNTPWDVAVDGSGNVYVVDMYNHRIQKFDAKGKFLAKWGGQGNGDGQFNYPRNVAVDGSGNVYVADSNNHRIQKFDAEGKFLAKWGSYGNGDGQFNYPRNVAIDGSGNVYVADSSNGRIQKFDTNGKFLWNYRGPGTNDGEFRYPRGVATDESGNVYVADSNNHRIQKFDAKGKFLAKWGGQGNGDGQFNTPWGVAMDGSGNVYVVDSSNNRIQKFDAKGKFLAKWGSSGNGDGQFGYPQGVAVDEGGNVYVVDSNNGRIQKFGAEGKFLAKWGGRGNGDGQFNSPQGVTVDGSGNVYVADSNNRRIQKFDSSGEFIRKWGGYGSDEGFNYPRGVAVDGSGNVYVLDSNNNRILKFKLLPLPQESGTSYDGSSDHDFTGIGGDLL